MPFRPDQNLQNLGSLQIPPPSGLGNVPPEISDFLGQLEKDISGKTIQRGEEAKRFLEKPFYKQIFSGRFARELPGATTETLLGTPARFIKSAAEAFNADGTFSDPKNYEQLKKLIQKTLEVAAKLKS